MNKKRLLVSWLLFTFTVWVGKVAAQENVDHAGIISAWNQQSVERGQKLFQVACTPCHGTDGVHTINPQSRPFAVDRFQNGSDPYSLYKTIAHGFKNMPSQAWLTPEQRYDVIDFIRETFLKKLNPSQFTRIDRAYLDSLPKFNPALAKAADAIPTQRDFGPVLESQLGSNFSDVLTFQLSDNVTLSYDLHHMRLAGAWKGGFLDLSQTGHFQQRGEGQPMPDGKPLEGLQHWSWAFGGRFDYPTNDLLPRGPLPPAWMRYRGHYVNGRQAVLAFSIEGRDILELPGAEESGDFLAVTHTFRIAPGPSPLRLCAGQSDNSDVRVEGILPLPQTDTRDPQQATRNTQHATPTRARAGAGENLAMASILGPTDGVKPPGEAGQSPGSFGHRAFIAAAAVGQTGGLTWQVDEQHRLVLDIPADTHPRVVRVICFAGKEESDMSRFGQYVRNAQQEQLTDPETLTHGAPRLWPATIEVSGKLGDQTGAYTLDTIPVPFKNPYGAWPRTSALAFFPDGRAVVTTYGGDVWIVSGIDAHLGHVTWSRFASGLFEPFGAQVIGGLVYVTCRNGIVRLHDFNGDGGADFYETFYSDSDVSPFFHSFNFDLQVDHAGNLYYAKSGEYTDYKLPGAVIEVSPDGKRSQVYCTGFRTPNGMGILPDDRLTVSDNQGNWMPASKISIVRPGGYYGYVQTLAGGADWAPDGGRIDPRKVKIPATFDQPIIWMPQEFDNSSGGEVWADDARFGPLSGRLLHTSFGTGWIYYLMLQDVDAVSQAAIVALPFQFDAGIMRARVNPADGQVYATGLSGWQGPAAGKDGCLQRLRYTGKPAKLLDDLKVSAGGFSLKFNFAVDPASALDPACYHLEEWNYLWAQTYGSDQYSIEHPGQKGHDSLTITAVKISNDGRSVFLTIPGLRPVNQVELRLNVSAADGTRFKELAYLTINALPRQ
jgi:glucose/arabinose dehydrogenase/mono/diheme cytochrome c family protein